MDTRSADTAADEATRRAAACCGAACDNFLDGMKKFRARRDGLKSDALLKARSAARTTGEAVQHHPFSAIGIAALAGLVLGFMASRR